MKYHYLFGVVSIAMALSSMDAQAGNVEVSSMKKPNGWYVGAEGGWTKIESPQSGPASSPKVSALSEGFDSAGYNVGLRGGYEWGALRLEEEFRYQHSSIVTIRDGVPPMTVPASGLRAVYALMTNAIYDFEFGGPLTPHIGVGIGAVGQHDAWTVPIGRCDDATDWQFGYQAIVGVRCNFTPTVAIDLDYRYLGTTDPTFPFSGSGSDKAGITGTTFTSGYATNNIVASLNVRF